MPSLPGPGRRARRRVAGVRGFERLSGGLLHAAKGVVQRRAPPPSSSPTRRRLACRRWSSCGTTAPTTSTRPPTSPRGMDLIWQSVDAVVRGGGWEQTVFMLTWDDWGGYDDHVTTPGARVHARQRATRPGATGPTADVRRRGQARHRQPLVLARQHPEDRAIDLLGLPALGVPRARLRPGPGRPGRPGPAADSSATRLRQRDRAAAGARPTGGAPAGPAATRPAGRCRSARSSSGTARRSRPRTTRRFPSSRTHPVDDGPRVGTRITRHDRAPLPRRDDCRRAPAAQSVTPRGGTR